jgi:hypothetical protein
MRKSASYRVPTGLDARGRSGALIGCFVVQGTPTPTWSLYEQVSCFHGFALAIKRLTSCRRLLSLQAIDCRGSLESLKGGGCDGSFRVAVTGLALLLVGENTAFLFGVRVSREANSIFVLSFHGSVERILGGSGGSIRSVGGFLYRGKGVQGTDGGNHSTQGSDNGKSHKNFLEPILFIALGLLITGCGIRSVLYGPSNDSSGGVLVILSGIAVYACGIALAFDRLLNRAGLRAKRVGYFLKPAVNPIHAGIQCLGGILKRDETRISRRPQGWRELQETCNGSPSKAKDNCGSEEEEAEGKNWLWGTGRWLLSRIAPSFLKRVRRLAWDGPPGRSQTRWLSSPGFTRGYSRTSLRE